MSVGQTTNNKFEKFQFFIFSFFVLFSGEMFFFLFCYCDFVSVRWCDFSTSVPSIFRRDVSSMKFHIARQLRISSWREIILLSQAVHNEIRFCHTMVRCWNQNEKRLIFFGNFSNQKFFCSVFRKNYQKIKCYVSVFWVFIERQRMKWNGKSRIAIVSLDEMNRVISLWIQLNAKRRLRKMKKLKIWKNCSRSNPTEREKIIIINSHFIIDILWMKQSRMSVPVHWSIAPFKLFQNRKNL